MPYPYTYPFYYDREDASLALLLLENAVTATQSFLSDNIAAKLNQLDGEYSDFELDDIVAWYMGNLPQAIPAYPSICVHGDGYEATEQRQVNLLVTISLDFIVFVGDPDEQRRFKKLCRYARALIELLQEGEATYGYSHFLEDRVEISDSLAAPPHLQAIVVPVKLVKLETY